MVSVYSMVVFFSLPLSLEPAYSLWLQGKMAVLLAHGSAAGASSFAPRFITSRRPWALNCYKCSPPAAVLLCLLCVLSWWVPCWPRWVNVCPQRPIPGMPHRLKVCYSCCSCYQDDLAPPSFSSLVSRYSPSSSVSYFMPH